MQSRDLCSSVGAFAILRHASVFSVPHCAAINCSNGTNNGFEIHRFPKECVRRRQWTQNCRRDKWSPTDNSDLRDVCTYFFSESKRSNLIATGFM
jgi:hypothetical protein